MCPSVNDTGSWAHCSTWPELSAQYFVSLHSSCQCTQIICLLLTRRGKLTHPSPDFSKVPPRVNFPKNSYKPPKSKRVIQQEGMAPEPPMVFKSPADIVREVLLSGGEDPREPRGPTEDGPHQPLNLTVPEGFRDPQQATALVQQLQVSVIRTILQQFLLIAFCAKVQHKRMVSVSLHEGTKCRGQHIYTHTPKHTQRTV